MRALERDDGEPCRRRCLRALRAVAPVRHRSKTDGARPIIMEVEALAAAFEVCARLERAVDRRVLHGCCHDGQVLQLASALIILFGLDFLRHLVVVKR